MSGRDISEVPSVLIGHAAPPTDLAPLEASGLPGLQSKDFAGKVTLVNVFASWCAPCRDEHPLLVELAKDDRFVLAGMNYKDKTENAVRFLNELGNPYKAIGADETGRTGIDWGVYGVPETFVVGKDGKIAYKHVGPLTPESVRANLMPEVEKALAAQP
jgi:cytochrome c biogenesis protein CcmG/thiol:disulfide interchange protein DsbE